MASSINILALVFLVFMTFYDLNEARTVIVGGNYHAWKVPVSANETLNHWAESQRFIIGDALEFYYDNKNDSVLGVTKEQYESCDTSKPLKTYKGVTGGPGAIAKLEVSGHHYFISGAPGNCGKGEKLDLVVQSPNHPPMPKPAPAPGATPPTPPSQPPTSPASPATPTPPMAPAPPTPRMAPAPAPNTAAELVAGNGIFWVFVTIIGLAWA